MTYPSKYDRSQRNGRNQRLLREPSSMIQHRCPPLSHDDINHSTPSPKARKENGGRIGFRKWLRKVVCCFQPTGFDEGVTCDEKDTSILSSYDTVSAPPNHNASVTSAITNTATLNQPSSFSVSEVSGNGPDEPTTPKSLNSGRAFRSWASSTSSTPKAISTASFTSTNKVRQSTTADHVNHCGLNAVRTLPAFIATVLGKPPSILGHYTSPKILTPSERKPPMWLDISAGIVDEAVIATLPTSPVTPTTPNSLVLAVTNACPDEEASPHSLWIQRGPVTPPYPEAPNTPAQVKAPATPSAPIDLRRIDVEMDGNCLFRAISKSLAFFNNEKLPEAEEQSQAMGLRLLAWDSICVHRSAEFEALQIFEGGLDRYRKTGCVDGVYAGEGELYALADVLGSKIEVYIIRGSGKLCRISSYGDEFVTRTRRGDGTIRLVYVNGNHYDALLPRA